MYGRNSVYNGGEVTVKKGGKARSRQSLYLLVVCIVILCAALGACTTAGAVQQPSDSSPQDSASSATSTTANISGNQVVATVPVTPVTPVVPATTTPPAQTVTPPPATSTPATVVNTPVAENLIRTPACQMALTINDMGQGWMKGNAVSTARGEIISSCSVHYYQGSSFAPVVQNTVAVYRSLDAASRIYAKEEANQAAVTHPPFGNECFLNDSVAISKLLVFRKDNVVVWIWLQQDKKGDLLPYANIVEPRIVK